MKKIISGLLACVALLSIGTAASADTEQYDSNKFATYKFNAEIMQKYIALDIVIPSRVEAAITTGFNVKTNQGFDINTSDTGIGNIDSTLMAMDFYSGEYQIINNSDVPIKIFTTLSATAAGKVNLIENVDADVEADDKKNLKLWLSSSMEEGGSKADRDKTTNKRIFISEPTKTRNADILITKKAPKDPSVLFECLPAKPETDGDTSNVGYFRINGQAKELPNPYWDEKDGIKIKFMLKIVPTSENE